MNEPFISGVIEGFYGAPWSRADRFTLFEWMANWGLNTYMYAPKDDLKHRAVWRQPYSAEEGEELRELISACRVRGLQFYYSISPGLDIRYSSQADVNAVKGRLEQMRSLGCENFCLLFDDIPDRIDPVDLARWGSLASAQCSLANEIFRWLRQRLPSARLFFCPTSYCGRMSERLHGGAEYLATVGRELLSPIQVFWTGPEIISEHITVDHIADVHTVLRRKPLIWDNLHANDYDGRRFFCGPYAGRTPGLKNAVSGVLLNPNNEFPLNFVPLRTLARYAQTTGIWDDRQQYLEAMREWLPAFQTAGEPITYDQLVLFGDCFYLPFSEGVNGRTFCHLARDLLGSQPEGWGEEAHTFLAMAGRLREICVRLTTLLHRPLFHALSRRVWELREEVDLLENFVRFHLQPENRSKPFASDFHLPKTYRGGLVPKLQQMLTPMPDGTFRATIRSSAHPSADLRHE